MLAPAYMHVLATIVCVCGPDIWVMPATRDSHVPPCSALPVGSQALSCSFLRSHSISGSHPPPNKGVGTRAHVDARLTVDRRFKYSGDLKHIQLAVVNRFPFRTTLNSE